MWFVYIVFVAKGRLVLGLFEYTNTDLAISKPPTYLWTYVLGSQNISMINKRTTICTFLLKIG